MKTIEECNEILKKCFPTDEDTLKEMPFGQSMLDAYNKENPSADPKGPPEYLHQEHLCKIVELMNTLLEGEIRGIIVDGTEIHAAFVVGDWTDAWRKIYGDQTTIEDQQMWRLEAFLHDVGKALTPSKHPSRGRYLITRLKTDDKKAFIEQLGVESGEEKFEQIEKVVAFHDRFGVLSTGESSLGILADVVERGSKENGKKAAQIISHIMVINLIDIGAAAPGGLVSEIVEVVLEDWKRACWDQNSPLRKSNGDRAEFEKMLLELAARDKETIDRIERLLRESYRRARQKEQEESGFDNSRWPDIKKLDFRSAARQGLETLVGGIHWIDFQQDLAHVAKIDYLLNLTARITTIHWGKYRSPNGLAITLVSVVQRLVDQFTDLIRGQNERTRIGIDLSVLRDTPEVQEQIANLLCGNPKDASYGLEWLVHEASAWPF